ncbi:MAG: hypothetical protein R3B90_07695 [Planctomycetaceae bacterium]
MAERKNTHGLQLRHVRGVTFVDIGNMEIWDGADLSLVRDTLNVLIAKRRRRAIGIDMRHVKYVPSGFFGMLYDYYEGDINIYLFRPQDRVENMLWFQRFFQPKGAGVWKLCDENEFGLDVEQDQSEREECEATAANWQTGVNHRRSVETASV